MQVIVLAEVSYKESRLILTGLLRAIFISLYYLKHEQQCFIRYKTRDAVDVLYSDKARTASVLNGLKNERYYLFICEVIFKINVV